jgi:short-subunit dehydrogenase
MSITQAQKTALITGASSGIGFACAELLAKQGYKLILISRRASKLETALQKLRPYGVDLYPMALNLCETDSAEKVFAFCKEKGLKPDMLICNAGMNRVGSLSNTSPEQITDILNLQVVNPTLLCRYFGREMKRARQGHIMIVSSLTAYTPYPTLSLYAASKRYLHQLSKSLAAELKPYHINVTNLCPGGVETDFFIKKGNFIRIAGRLHLMKQAREVAVKGLKALYKGKSTITPGFFNRLLITGTPIIPQACIAWFYHHTSLFANITDDACKKNTDLQEEVIHPNKQTQAFALVTGGSSGIGWEYAKILAQKSYSILLISNKKEDLEEKSNLLRERYAVETLSLYMDLSQPGAAEQIIAFCHTHKLDIEILINNAGFFMSGNIVHSDANKIKSMLHLHISTLTLLCRYVGEDMQNRKKGYILNMSSLSAWMPYPNIALYASTKRYIRDFSLAIRPEYIKHNVSVSVLTPGAIDTNLYHLSPYYQNLAKRCGIMMSPEKMAKKAIKVMFRRKASFAPGWINRLAIPFLVLAPLSFIYFIERKLEKVFTK